VGGKLSGLEGMAGWGKCPGWEGEDGKGGKDRVYNFTQLPRRGSFFWVVTGKK